MIIYFADREMQVRGHASTNLQKGYVIKEDLKTEDVETGVASFSCRVGFDETNRLALEEMANAGNYLLRSNEDENEFYTIIDVEIDTKNKDVYIYAEDAGLDLLNEIAGEFEATEANTAEWYINKYIVDSGFEIGINEISEDPKKLKWEGEDTVTARLASIATQFGDYEISYSFAIKGLAITNKYINIHKKRGKDVGVTLRLNKDIDRIVTTKSVANLATAFVCEGGVKDNEETPITFTSEKFTYDDGDFFVDGNKVKSRKANAKWSRYVWNKEPNKLKGFEGYIVRPYSYNTTKASTLYEHAVTELKKVCDMEVNYEIDVTKLPEGTKIGDRINIVDDAGEMYVSSRVLQIEASVVDQKHKATLGEHLIKESGISEKVKDLAEQFAQNSQSAVRALAVANAANTKADAAKEQVEASANEVEAAKQAANEAKNAADLAAGTANKAQEDATAAQEAVGKVENSVSSLEQTITNAQNAAENAQAAAGQAQTKADEAAQAAAIAQVRAAEAKTASQTARAKAENAVVAASGASTAATTAKENAKEAIETARAAKLDAEQAERDVAKWSENLETFTDTLKAEYTRKTDLTETTAELQAQISRNAAGLNSSVSLLQTVDETANNAREKATAAQTAATEAQAKADEALADANAAQTAADTANQAAIDAQAEADSARTAAETARSVADQAQADLEAAKEDLATIQARADATAEEIAAAQSALNSAQSAANTAKAEADAAAERAATAQNTASTAAANAWKAQQAADSAKADADIAQQLADKLLGDWETADAEATDAETIASQAKTAAEEAQVKAETAQSLAGNVLAQAEAAQQTADEAAETAENAQRTAEIAASQVAQANEELAKAQERLAEVLADVDATEEEVSAAEADVEAAQTAADNAEAEAEAAQTAATEARAAAEQAQEAAANAKEAAKTAQADANAAQDAANQAQSAVDGLAVRVTKAETNIAQKASEIELRVSEVEEETTANEKRITKSESRIKMLTDSIAMLVRGEDGGSLIKQDATGAYWFDVSSILKDLEGASNGVDVLNATAKELTERVEYVRSYTDENGNPTILLGEGDSEFKVYVTNKEIRFEEGTASPAKISRQMLIIEKTMIRNELQFGDDEDEQTTGVWIWKRRSNGNLGLMWKGVNN